MEDKIFDFWFDVICRCSRAESEHCFSDYLIYYKGIITLIRELGVSSVICSRLWDSIVLTGKDIFYEKDFTS